MKKLWIFLVFLFPCMVFAQIATTSISGVSPTLPAVSHDEFLQALLQSLGGVKGASALTAAGIIVQLLLKFLGTDWAGQLLSRVSGVGKLALVSGLAIGGGILTLMTVSGLSFSAALVHSATLTAFMVYGNQWVKQLASTPPPAL